MKKVLLLLVIIGAGVYFLRSEPMPVNIGNNGTRIVAFGDSLTAGYGAPKELSYPSRLAARVKRPVINLGLSGDTAINAPNRLADVLASDPYMVLIEFGANDFMRSLSFEESIRAIEKIVEQVQAAGAIAVIVDTGGYALMSRYTKAYKRIAKEKKAVFVPAIMDGIMNKPSLKSDQIHPNDKGYQLIADKVYKHIEPYL